MTQAGATKSQVPLIGKLTIKSLLTVETGLHIGGGGETLDIGGLDKPVIRNPINRHPYIPGSSIKGKLRALLERYLPNIPLNRENKGLYRHECDHIENWLQAAGQNSIQRIGAKDCPICRVFGSTGRKCLIPTNQQPVETTGDNKPARLIVRDSQLSAESVTLLENIDTGLYMTEWKFENGLDRITAAANPRQVERVPAGSRFNFELVYTVENEAQAVEDLKHLAIALAILEDDALGGHGSRGYGKVRFENFQFYYRGIEQYKQVGTTGASLLEPFKQLDNTAALLSEFGTLSSEIQTRLLPGDSNAE
jgi:CRISPR-associated protein Csm3